MKVYGILLGFPLRLFKLRLLCSGENSFKSYCPSFKCVHFVVKRVFISCLMGALKNSFAVSKAEGQTLTVAFEELAVEECAC